MDNQRKQRKPIRLTGREELEPAKNDDVVFDLEMRGLALRLRRSGDRVLRSWVLVYRSRGKGRRYQIGRADVLSAVQARKASEGFAGEAHARARPARRAGGG